MQWRCTGPNDLGGSTHSVPEGAATRRLVSGSMFWWSNTHRTQSSPCRGPRLRSQAGCRRALRQWRNSRPWRPAATGRICFARGRQRAVDGNLSVCAPTDARAAGNGGKQRTGQPAAPPDQSGSSATHRGNL